MKQRQLYIIAWVVLTSFLFVQIPFSLLHDHGHKTNCVYTGGTESSNKTNSKHVHENNTKPCFVCSASLSKDFVSLASVYILQNEIVQKYFAPSTASYHFNTITGKHSRGPPVM